eukprot:TRINITY_DN7453_c0_g1_i1.p1 TRINITY_DN7453_c0_g1~~TRINITY_DN7453_c0_g1_i1.p1  ORF type:complete len:257 (+),score=28.87 TRINITY_DN7453_c0_g1_i1:394-1164(+)
MYRHGSGTQQQNPHQPIQLQQPWYPPTGVGPSVSVAPGSVGQGTNSPRISSSGAPGPVPFPRVSSSGGLSSDSRPHSPGPGGSRPQGHAARTGISLASLKDRSVRDLETLLKSKEAYNTFLQSLEQVKHSESLVQDLRKSNVELVTRNLAKDATISELKNQCTIIRTTELAAAREKFEEARARERELLNRISPSALSEKLQQATTEADEESETQHRRFVQGEIELGDFILTYRKQRLLFHNRSLTRLSLPAMTHRG